jgi:ATP-dependent Clp protease protease subunit
MKPAASRWYAIQSTENGSAQEVHIYDEIGGYGVGAKEFIAELKQHSGNRIHLRINSVGGSVTEGLAIANAIKRHKGGVTAHVDGLAASMATVIAVSADETVMADNGIFMVHEPWSVGQGTADDLRAEAAVLDKMKKSLVRAYTKKTGMDDDEVEDLMRAETWMNAQEALSLGFIDYIEDGMEAAASITPEAARARFDTFQNSMARKTTKTIKAEEAAPAEVVAEPTVEAPVADEAVDTSSEVNMNAELQAQVDELQARLAEVEAAKVDAEAVAAQSAEDVAKEIETLRAEVERLASESAAKDEEIGALRAASKSAGEQAAAIVAGIGVDPSLAQPELTPAQKFASLTGPEATTYFRAHKSEIIKSLNS